MKSDRGHTLTAVRGLLMVMVVVSMLVGIDGSHAGRASVSIVDYRADSVALLETGIPTGTTSSMGGSRRAVGNQATVAFNVTVEESLHGHTVGLVEPESGRWHLYDAAGLESVSFFYGDPGDSPFMGDWDGDGVETPGLYRQSDGYVYLRNSNTQGIADIKFFFGNPGDVPVAGDFDNDGFDTVSIYRPSNQTFYIINKLGSNDGGLGAAEFFYVFGNPGDKPFVGDFDGDGVETVGLHRESSGLVYFRNTHTQGIADAQFIYGDPGDRFVAGDWNGDGVFSPALFRPSNTTMYFRYTNTQGNADYEWIAGQSSWLPVSGATNVSDGPQYAHTFYVDVDHPSASDSNPGTESRPWRTFVHAGAMAGPGERVLVKAGIYDHGDIEIEHGGVTFAAYPGDERLAIVRGAGVISHGNSDLVINGFRFENSPGHAIRIVGPNAQNIVVSNNHTYDTAKSGISIRGVTGNADPGGYDNIRNVLVTGNLVELANHGDGGEIISVASGAVNVDIAHNEIRIGDPVPGDGDEGISFKEGVRDSRIFGNLLYDLSDKAIIIDGGSSIHDPLVTNIEIFDNVFYNLPSNGMWVTTEGQGDVDGVHIHDNIVYGVEGNGILVYQHPGGAAAGGTVRNVLIEHNTVWNNGSHSGYGGIRVDHPSAPGVVIRDNIAWGNNGYDIRGDNGTTIDGHNLCREVSLCRVTSDPRFVDPPTDFRLRADSPAIGTASDGSNLGVR